MSDSDSPLWDINLYEWTQDAVNNGDRTQLREEFHILGLVESGFLTKFEPSEVK